MSALIQKAASKTKKSPKLSRLNKPADLSLEEWQRELRRQFGREQNFGIKNLGDDAIFSEFQITNPQSKSVNRVTIRGKDLGDNYCTCGDFATNTLGTCKHIEFTLAELEPRRGGKAALDAGFQPAYSEVLLQYGAQREVRFRPGRDCPAELARSAAKFFGADGELLPDAFPRFEDFLNQAGQSDHELRCRDDVLEFVAEVRDRQRRQEILDKAFPKGPKSPAMKSLVKATLYDYQAEGALFAARAGRCLLGDEMGLGKTIQAIAAAEIMARHFGVERVLIICPTSLKHQWQREIERFTGRSAQVIGGLRPARSATFREASFFKILNYDTVHTDLDLIQAWAPDLVILDEAQRIKNWNTRVARNVKQIASPYALVLTGTPLENRLEELVSIVQFVDRFRLGPTFRLLDRHQVRDDAGKVVGYRDLNRLGQTLEPVLLRRLKSKVMEQLPQRLEKNFFVPMTDQQREMHEENREVVARIVQRWRKFKFLSEADQRRLMIALQNMRMACDSTYLLDQSTNEGVKSGELVTLLQEMFEKPDTKVVLFSQWVRMHEVIQPLLRKKGWDHVLFHGGVPGNKRKDLVDRFRDDPKCRVFLSTDAGGVGLNLQFASIVVNMDLPWNPAVLEQRIGRVHRLGQRQPVQVVNFVAQGTIEEGMLGVLKFKKSLFAGVLDGGDKEIFMGGSRLTKFMESVEKATNSIPQADAADEQPHGETSSKQESANPLADLVTQGAGFLASLSAALKAPASSNPFIGQVEGTGEKFLKLPLPKPEMLDNALKALGDLLASFR
jgi:superfamily II DNA or RNA helicase